MRTTVDIPDETYRELKIKAAREGKSLRDIVLRGLERELGPSEVQPRRKKFQIPVIPTTRTDKLCLTNEEIDDILASS